MLASEETRSETGDQIFTKEPDTLKSSLILMLYEKMSVGNA